MRRNVNITYIIENNGVYGLTKGQFSATADVGSVMKGGKVNDIPAIDLAELAITLGATYVARSFSGDRKQLTPMVQGALAHRGSAILDVISPCVTFNNHEGSTKSLKYVKGHLDPIHDLDFIPPYENIEADYDEGTDHEVTMTAPRKRAPLLFGYHDVEPRDRDDLTQARTMTCGRPKP